MIRLALGSMIVCLVLGAAPALADLQLYPVESIPNLPEIDDGTARLKFDFSKVKLSDKYDGFTCSVTLIGDGGRAITPLAMAKAKFKEKGHLDFSGAQWLTRGLSKPEDLYRSNLAVTAKGQVVGALLLYNFMDEPGQPTHPPQTVIIKTSDGALDTEKPEGDINLDTSDGPPAVMRLAYCRK